ncbi:MAG: hypothetical protein FWE34_05960 [Defluviitaleaceae bacterium]|nr:hypothetical protein [Defluviitaleaceae bacterium]
MTILDYLGFSVISVIHNNFAARAMGIISQRQPIVKLLAALFTHIQFTKEAK